MYIGGLFLIVSITAVFMVAWLITPCSPQLLGVAYRRVATQEKVIALTYDDGPMPEATGQLINLLNKHNVKATFFFIGTRIEKHGALVKHVWKAGHEIGNHSWSHSHLVGKSSAYIHQEIKKTDAAIRETGYPGVVHFRAPKGLKLWRLPAVLRRMGKVHILFDVVAWDWLSPGKRYIVRRVLKSVKSGSIILLHDGCGNSADMLAATEVIIKKLKASGYRFVTTSELLALKDPASCSVSR